MITKVSTRGNTVSVRFGTSEVRDLSDGKFPVQIWRVWEFPEGHYRAGREERMQGRAMRPDTVEAACRRHSRGWRAGARRGWLELRTPPSRIGDGGAQ